MTKNEKLNFIIPDAAPLCFSRYRKFLEFLEEREKQMSWKEVNLDEARLVVFNKLPMMLTEKDFELFSFGTSQQRIEEIGSSYGLTIRIGDTLYIVNENAFDSLLKRYGADSPLMKALILGKDKNSQNPDNVFIDCISEETTNYIVDILNDNHRFLTPDVSQALFMNGEFVTFNSQNYRKISQVEVFRRTMEHFRDLEITELGGFEYSVNYTSGSFMLFGLSDKLNEQYDFTNKINAMISVQTSDTAKSAVTIQPKYSVQLGHKTYVFPLGHPMRLDHRGENAIEDYELLMNNVYSRYSTSMEDIEYAQKTQIRKRDLIAERVLNNIDNLLTKKERSNIEMQVEISLMGDNSYMTIFDLMVLIRDSIESTSAVKDVRVDDTLYRLLINSHSRVF